MTLKRIIFANECLILQRFCVIKKSTPFMKIKQLILLVLLGLIAQFATAQDDPVLFSVDGKDVLLSEFDYIYSKTNGDTTTYSRASLEEYLELYKKFKLKVAAAKAMKLDTIPSLQQELAGYRRQLADSYLTDKEVTETLVKEAYERSKTDLGLSHIMVAVGEKQAPADTLEAYNKIMKIKDRLDMGADFSDMVQKFSDDGLSKKNNGSLGYLVAPFPNGFYELENAAYATKEGEVGGPVRTQMGYHLVKVNDRRPARGELEMAHILMRVNPQKPETAITAVQMIDSLYEVLKNGGNFGELARKYSQDKPTAPKDGYIGYFGINRYDKSFEDKAFALTEDGQMSKPIKSSVGWHILKRLGAKQNEPYQIAKRRLQPKIQKDQRFQLAKQAMVERIKSEGNFKESPGVLENWINELDGSFLTFKWKPQTPANPAILAYFGEEVQRSLNDFEKFCQKSSRKRIQKAGNVDPKVVARTLYDEFTAQMCLDYEESQLEIKYPDFKSLMREYEEGILLFEATKLQVWDKASIDTIGLQNFYEANKDNYQWKKRADLITVNINPIFKKLEKKVRKIVKKKGIYAAEKKFNVDGKTVLASSNKLVEEGRNEYLDKMTWGVGEISESRIDKKTGHILFDMIKAVLPPSTKTLAESRGYVIADYQDQLEKEWVADLRKQYPIEVNQASFERLVKE